MAARTGHRSAEEDQMLVFENGTCLEYPAYEKASNGFVRGPKGEKIGRGWEAELKAEEMCKEHINKYILAFKNFGSGFAGVTANMRTKLAWSNRMEWDWTGRAPGNVHIYAKCYFGNHPDAYEVYGFSRTLSGINGRVSVWCRSLQYTNVDAFDSEGFIEKYHDLSSIDSTGQIINTSWMTHRDSLQLLVNLIKEHQTAFEHLYTKVEWSTDLDNVYTKADEYLDSRETMEEISTLLPQLSKLYQELGYQVTTTNASDGRGGYLPAIHITSGEHTVILSGSPLIQCHFERDEDRLTHLQKLRLEDELRHSVETHGDIRDTSTLD